MSEGAGTGRPWFRIFISGFGGILSLPVLLLAVIWGLHEESALRQGRDLDVPTSLHGYNVFITGSTSGIGFEAALEFFRLGAHVLIHSSNYERAKKSAADVRSSVGGGGRGRATPVAANLAHFNEVRRLAQELPKAMHRVDILILNACKMYGLAPDYGKGDLLTKQPDSAFQTPSGHDAVLTVNHLGHYLLTELLLPILAHGATIVIMSAMGAWDGSHLRILPLWGYLGKTRLHPKIANQKRIFWEKPGLKQYAFKAYHDSKLANICYGRWLRRRLSKNASVVLHDPGYVTTTPTLSRDSVAYKRRLSRGEAWRQTKLRMWHAPPQDAGRHLLEAAFVKRLPMPDIVASYFMPRQVVSWFASYEWEVKRARYVSEFQNYQKLLWGLHETIGPKCDEALQDQLARWSAEATAAPRAPGRG